MAERPSPKPRTRPKPTEFVYHNIELCKSESLGSGSYGGVCKAKCDGLLCAAKIMHPTLFDLRDPGTASYLSKFREECHLLSLARHPNIVQYLGTFTDPDTRLPVLLMELCEESLTAFLERSPGPLSYHVQVDICHDIALALVYLHSNGLIHRDLTRNNVLMIAGPRAKITDFGMSKLANVNPRMTALTLCPGNVLYMSPEALDEAKSYTAKLDVFSFGVIVIQILTRQFPNPTDRFRLVSFPHFTRPLRQEVPEVQRRAAHLKFIPASHSLKPLVLQCLRIEDTKRPSALELSERLSDLKQSSQYKCGAECNQCIQCAGRISELEKVVGNKDRELHDKNHQLQLKDQVLQRRDRELQIVIDGRDKALERLKRELQASEQLVSKFQQSLQQKHKTNTDLLQTISTYEKKIQQLEQQDMASRDTPHQMTFTMTQAGRDISNMKWRKGKNAPEPMSRGAAVVSGNIAYFRPANSVKVYSYHNTQGGGKWSQLPDNPNKHCGLVIINNHVTSVGGSSGSQMMFINSLLSIQRKGEESEVWAELFPPMPTPRFNAACVTTKDTLIVAGGEGKEGLLNRVEVMDIEVKIWTTAVQLPQSYSDCSATLNGDTLYVGGGYIALSKYDVSTTKQVISCSLTDLTQPAPHESSMSAWKEIKCLPIIRSTLLLYRGDLLALGGRDDAGPPTHKVFRYDTANNSWSLVNGLNICRAECLAVTLQDEVIVIVGGYSTLHHSNEVDISYFKAH